MAVARDNHTAVELPDGRVALVGGFLGEGEPVTSSVDVVDADGGGIDATTPLRHARGGHAGGLLPDGRILVVGGWTAPHTYTASAELLDVRHGTVGEVADLPYAADALDAVTLGDGRILVTGGRTATGGTDAATVFDPANGTWTAVGPMSTPRFKHFSLLLPDGRALIIGGTTDDRTILASTELFYPRTGRFTPGPTLSRPRYKLAGGAALLDDGRVLVGGGASTVEVLDVQAGTSTAIPTPAASGSFTTVTPLGDDRFLLLGGYDDRIRLRRQLTVLEPTA
jgi:hypothetical protein